MIKIKKSISIPRPLIKNWDKDTYKKLCDKKQDELLNNGETETLNNCDIYNRVITNNEDFDGKTFSFKAQGLYNKPVAKEQIMKDQHYKCCYCETKIKNRKKNKKYTENTFGYGVVEHFRPKAAYKQNREKLNYPGYYWLAYVWENLFFACEGCNGNKGNLFPLQKPDKRTKNHNCKLEPFENTLLINPLLENPEKHIKFHDAVPYGISDKGTKTIEICKLERLNETRDKYLTKVKKEKSLIDLEYKLTIRTKAINVEDIEFDKDTLKMLMNDAKDFIENATKNEAPYSNMVRCYLSGLDK